VWSGRDRPTRPISGSLCAERSHRIEDTHCFVARGVWAAAANIFRVKRGSCAVASRFWQRQRAAGDSCNSIRADLLALLNDRGAEAHGHCGEANKASRRVQPPGLRSYSGRHHGLVALFPTAADTASDTALVIVVCNISVRSAFRGPARQAVSLGGTVG